MEKITNKKFIDFLRSEDKKILDGKESILLGFEHNINELENLIEKRIINKIDHEDSIPYINIKHFLERYINATKFKFIDLSAGLVSCINSGSFSGALTISRTVLENIAMLHLKTSEFIKLLNNKNYVKLLHELLKMNVKSHSAERRIKDYKRTHVNDALKHFSKKFDSGEFTRNLYDNVSERVHPSPSSFMMYIDSMKKSKNKYQNSFSFNSKDIQGHYSFIALTLVDIVYTVESIYPDIQKDLIDLLKNSKLSIEMYFKHNSEDNKKHNELISRFNT
jgi:hypothetical protein